MRYVMDFLRRQGEKIGRIGELRYKPGAIVASFSFSTVQEATNPDDTTKRQEFVTIHHVQR